MRRRIPTAFVGALLLVGAIAGFESARPAEQPTGESKQDMEKLRSDLRHVADVLDRELDSRKPSTELETFDRYVPDLQQRLGQVRQEQMAPTLRPALERLKTAIDQLARQPMAQEAPREALRAVPQELRWVADNASSVDEALQLLREGLTIPAVSDEVASAEERARFFPEDLTVEQFRRIDPIRRFLVKHRLKRPPTPAATTAAAIMAGNHHVQVGVEIEGVVSDVVPKEFDRDYTFSLDGLHVEIPPHWRQKLSAGLPTKGQRVRIKGWTYYDAFHEDEETDQPVVRNNVWEVHPVQELVVVSVRHRTP